MTTLEVTTENLGDLGFGCAAYGTGGGGDVGPILMATQVVLQRCGPVPIITLDQIGADELIVPLSSVGAPTAGTEILGSGMEATLIRDEIERRTGQRVAAVMAAEIGGGNGVAPVGWAAELGLPLLDADGMGRAFPELQMISMNAAHVPSGVVTIADALGNVASLVPVDSAWAERWTRALCVASGSTAVLADYVMTARQAEGAVIEGTVSRALALGQAVRTASDPVQALVHGLAGTPLISGKVVDIARVTEGGFVRGTILIEGLAGDAGRRVEIQVQNECLAAREGEHLLACVPDLIGLFDSVRADAIPIESVHYGQRVCVVAAPCDAIWRTARGLDLTGPAAFGLDLTYRPIEEKS